MNLLAEPLYATLLVLVVTNTRVILAADSRKNTLHPDGTCERGSMDKIFQTGDCYYAVSGFSSTEDGSFSLPAVIHKALISFPDFSKAVEHLAKAIATELKAYLTGLKKESPELFTRLLRDSHSGGEIVLIKREYNRPAAVLFTYQVTGVDNIMVVVDRWSIDCTAIKSGDDCFWRAIGHAAYGKKGLPSAREVARSPVATIRRIMVEGAKAHPQFVGGPLNIVALNPKEERWIEKSSTAPAHL